MKCSEVVKDYMHELLDGDISPDDEQLLREHLVSCPDCKEHFDQLKMVSQIFQEAEPIQAPVNFTANVMANLPKQKQRVKIRRWLHLHPLLTAASLFLVLMTSGFISSWQKDQEFSVTKNPNLVVKDHVVTVPKGKTVKGNIVVKNGELRVEGEVQGDITVINGERYVASAGNVTGEVEEVNKVFDWVWFKIKHTAKKVTSVFAQQ